MILLAGACILIDLVIFTYTMFSPIFFFYMKIWPNIFKHLQQREHIDIGVFTIFACVIVGMLSLFLYCFFGKLATESFAKMADCLYESNWQILNVKCQKYFVLMIENAQQPLYYQGFGIAVMNLETFTKVSEIKQNFCLRINSNWSKCNFFSF